MRKRRLLPAAGRLIASFLLIALCALAYYVFKSGISDVRLIFTPFSRSVCSALAYLFSAFPFSAAEFLFYILIASAAACTIYTLVMLIIRAGRFSRALDYLSRMILGASVLLFLFTYAWGLDYLAPPLSVTLGLDTAPRPQRELFETAEALLGKVNVYAALVSRDDVGVSDFGDYADIAGKVKYGYLALARRYPFYEANMDELLAPKAVTAWPLMSYAGISGIFTPFTGEANVNPSTPQASLPFTIAHEVSHRLGVGPENEANFSAFLSCIYNPDVAYIYSGYFEGFLYCYNAVTEIDQVEQAKLWSGLNPYAMEDIKALIKYNMAYEGPVQEAGTKINDVYLKAMQQEEGVRSYGEVTDLIIAWFETQRG